MTLVMFPSKSKTFIKISLVGLSLLLWPVLGQAKTLVFDDQKWEVNITSNGVAFQPYVRNDFSLAELARNAILGSNLNHNGQLLSAQTLSDLEPIATIINQQPQDAKLIIQNNRALEFNPGQKGQSLDLYNLSFLLQSEMTTINLPVLVSEPQIPLSSTNNLGINELVSVGESNFTGSPANRIHNITVGASKFDGLIIQPGEEFSFNRYLGDVDAVHGFLPELVIKPEGVTPEFGGGLCQVSTTTFRAAMNAGLPITARRNHSFAVQYYAPQGTDATIYPGSADVKFINNLPTALLIHTKIVGKLLYFEYYGTKDDRLVAFEGPVQYDKKPDGSMKATWTRHVTLNSQTTTQVFQSTYLSPALFHHDSVIAPSTPNPDAQPSQPITQ